MIIAKIEYDGNGFRPGLSDDVKIVSIDRGVNRRLSRMGFRFPLFTDAQYDPATGKGNIDYAFPESIVDYDSSGLFARRAKSPINEEQWRELIVGIPGIRGFQVGFNLPFSGGPIFD